MVDHRIPMSKQSKKAQKAYYKSMRRTWDINPVQRVVPNKKRRVEKVDLSYEE